MKETLKLVRIADTTEGYNKKGEPWRKTNALFETVEQYPKTICVGAFNLHIEELMAIPVGSTCDVSFDISSREFNGKFYTDCTLLKIEAKTGQQPQADPQPKLQAQSKQSNISEDPKYTGDDLPF